MSRSAVAFAQHLDAGPVELAIHGAATRDAMGEGLCRSPHELSFTARPADVGGFEP